MNIKKIVYVEFPILLFITAVYYLMLLFSIIIEPIGSTISSEESRTFAQMISEYWISNISAPRLIIFVLSAAVIAGILRLVTILSKREFRYYFAKAFLGMASKEKEEIKKTNYFIKGIKSYDKYLRRNMNLQIRSMKSFLNL